MGIDFDNIQYLQHGNAKQRCAYHTLMHHGILSKLARFEPVLVGTIPIQIDIDNSDLDVICYCTDRQEFVHSLMACFNDQAGFYIREEVATDRWAIVANFFVDGFAIEVFGQDIPTKQQSGYRHLLIEHRLLTERGELFRQQVIELKRQGYKTEPAFAQLLGLPGDPYTALLNYEPI